MRHVYDVPHFSLPPRTVKKLTRPSDNDRDTHCCALEQGCSLGRRGNAVRFLERLKSAEFRLLGASPSPFRAERLLLSSSNSSPMCFCTGRNLGTSSSGHLPVSTN